MTSLLLRKKQAYLVTIFCVLQVSIAFNSFAAPPLPYRFSGVPGHSWSDEHAIY